MIRLKKVLQSPITLFISMVCGVLTGHYLKGAIVFLEPIGRIYTSILQAFALPAVICSVTVSSGKIFNRAFRTVMKRWVLFVLLVAVLSGIIGVFSSSCMSNFLTPDDQTKVLFAKASDERNGKEISDSFSDIKIYDKNNIANESSFSFSEFLMDIVPKNIFIALSENRALEILCFFVMFGIMLTSADDKYSSPIVDLIGSIRFTLGRFGKLLLLFLPVSIFIMMSSLFSDINLVKGFGMVFNLILVNYITLTAVIIIFFIVISIRTKIAIKQHLSAIKRIFFLSIGTGQNMSVMPVAVQDSVEKMNLDKTIVSLVVPTGALFFPTGTIITSAILAVYATLIYGTSVGILSLLIIVFSSILFSVSGVSGSATHVLPIMLQPLGLPTDLIATILTVSSQFYVGLRTFVNIYSHLAIASLISPKDSLVNGELRFQQGVDKGVS